MKAKGWLLFGRWVLRLALVAWLVLGAWNAGRNIMELRALQERGRTGEAQVIGREITAPQAKTGYVHYAYKVDGYAVENHFVVPRSAYPEYPTGRAFAVTYLPEQPHTHRLGTVTGGLVLRTEFLTFLLAIIGLLALGLPLLAIEAALHPRRPAMTPVSV